MALNYAILDKLSPTKEIRKQHPLKNWFMSRGISLKQLAVLTKSSETMICHHMNGVIPFPERILSQLVKFKAEIAGWEQLHKKSFRDYGRVNAKN